MTRVAEIAPGTEGEIIPVVIVCQAEEGDGKCYLLNIAKPINN